MPWKIASFTALVSGGVVRTLPQGVFEDLLWPELDVPELDVPKIDEPELTTWATYHTEPASTPSRVEHITSLLHQPSSSTTQLATPTVRTPTLSHLTPTSWFPPPTSEGHTTQTSIRVTSTGPNTILPASHPWSPPAELPQRHIHADVWRVVGIAVIAVTVVGTTILAVVFFDQWWNFLCDVCGRRTKRRKSGKEELVPDWERRSWEFRTEGNLPAYPSFGSPPARQNVEEAASQAQSLRVNMGHPSTLSDCSNIPPVLELRENNQRTVVRGSPYGSTESSVRRLSPSHGVMVHTSHYTLSRSDTQKTTSSEDAYDGLAAE
ncbi:hypothetical protein BJY52DRAFT_1256792 [Lactarius psammicola]|nr:hypothetical protein BJY52DRAFT_1256792 [Lactarius psammicola]